MSGDPRTPASPGDSDRDAAGEFIEVAGLQVHTLRDGQGPPILLLAALGSNWFDLQPLTVELRDHWQVLRYDRPGYGLSQPRQFGRVPTLQGEIDRIRAVLDHASADKAVLVAHSMASLYAEGFARALPDRVSGIVMIEGSYVTVPWRIVPPRLRVIDGHLLIAAVEALGITRPLLKRFGANRLRAMFLPAPPGGFTDHEKTWAPRVFGGHNMLLATITENAAFPTENLSLRQLRRDRDLPEVPKAVIAALPRGRRWARIWATKQKSYSRMLGAKFHAIRPARHFVILERPHEVAEIIDETFGRTHEETR